MLRLIRLTLRQSDIDAEKRLRRVSKEAKFTGLEVQEFQEVFDNCWNASLIFEDHPEDDGEPRALSMNSLFRLMKSMGVKLDVQQKSDLTSKVAEISEGKQFVDFCCFLIIMRWMMDVNFVNINGSAATNK